MKRKKLKKKKKNWCPLLIIQKQLLFVGLVCFFSILKFTTLKYN